MNRPILKSISKFLERGLDCGEETKVARAYFQCAKDMVDELIKAEAAKDSLIEVDLSPLEPKPEVKAKVEAPPNKDDYRIVVDKEGCLAGIDGLPMDALLLVDGVKTTLKDALGKPFKTGRILNGSDN